jgi:DNA (cytosine-5)-methyltransferase 1
MKINAPACSPNLSAIDLFCGAGGISLGLAAAGYRVLAANDSNQVALHTYSHNFPTHTTFEGDVRQLEGSTLLRTANLAKGELDLLIGGPPCQGFSIIGSRLILDPRNDLFREFLRLADVLRPRALVMENVPGLATLAGGRILEHVLAGFTATGYRVGFAELLAAQYGVPQMRWRMVFVAFRKDLGFPPNIGFPLPTHGKRGIGELVPNCTIRPQDLQGFVTTREAIGDLPKLDAGCIATEYTESPSCGYQERMRQGASKRLHNHYAPRLAPQNLARIKALKAGQDWRDLPTALLPEGMKRAKRKDHTRRYSRMTWDGVPRSVITRFRDPKSGEYTHPEQDRTISIREAARIQSFPDSFVFQGSYSDQYEQVGNAVPPILAEAIGRAVAECLVGNSRVALSNPFSRRPNLLQARLALDSL